MFYGDSLTKNVFGLIVAIMKSHVLYSILIWASAYRIWDSCHILHVCMIIVTGISLVTMEKAGLFLAVLLTTLLHQSVCRIFDSPLKVFYVKPTVPRTECPSGDSPCHSLQYYANHSSNSRFLFLEGEHHLDSVVTISNVANLSLVGGIARE